MASSDALIGKLTGSAENSDAQAKDFFGQSQDLLGPVSDFLKQITSSDPSAVMQATMPQRRRVIDQYSAAKKAIAEFSPRGGGQAASTNKLLASQAGDLSDITGNARMQGMSTAGDLASRLSALGTSQQQVSQSALAQALAGTSAQDAQKSANLAALGQGLGTMLGFVLAA